MKPGDMEMLVRHAAGILGHEKLVHMNSLAWVCVTCGETVISEKFFDVRSFDGEFEESFRRLTKGPKCRGKRLSAGDRFEYRRPTIRELLEKRA